MYEQYFQDAVEIVSSWPDIDDDEFSSLVVQQAMLMSGCCNDYYLGTMPEFPSISHR